MISGLKVCQGYSPSLLKRITSIEFEMSSALYMLGGKSLAIGKVGGTRIFHGPMNIIVILKLGGGRCFLVPVVKKEKLKRLVIIQMGHFSVGGIFIYGAFLLVSEWRKSKVN
jgi:hypothetical protein